MTQPLGEKAPNPALSPAAAKAPASDGAKKGLVEGQRVCTVCGRTFDLSTLFCPDDGNPLEAKQLDKPDPYVGQVILEHIEIQRLAGVGAMGRVYRAHQRGLDRDVAVKVLHRELSANKELVGRFIREAKLASRIVHPNVVQVHLAGQLPDGALYIVMEFLDGLSLQSALAASPNGALPLERSLHIALQLCRAVGEAHTAGIVHRDLKPENVMLVRRGADTDFVKVLDFGIARSHHAEHASMATAQGLIFGTARYISPEGARGEPATAASDVYSLAILFYQLLTGRTPFDADQAVGLLLQHIHETPPPLRAPAGEPALPASVCHVILDNLAKHPDDRAANARVFGEQLRRAAREAKVKLAELQEETPEPGAATSMWNPPVATPAPVALLPTVPQANRPPPTEIGNVRPPPTEIATPGPPRTEFAEPDLRAHRLIDGDRQVGMGTLRITPSHDLSAPAELLHKPNDRTLPVVSRPPELARLAHEVPQPLAPPPPEPPASRRWWWIAVAAPLLLLLGWGIGRLLATPAVTPPPLLTTSPPQPAATVSAPVVDLNPEEDPLSSLDPVRPTSTGHVRPPPSSSNVPPSNSSAAASNKPGNVRVTVGRTSAVTSINQPAEFTAVVFDGPDRAGNKVEAANFTFNGEGMNSVVPAMLDGQGVFRTQLTFYKAGSYLVTFGGLLGGKPIGGSHRFTVTSDHVAPTPPLPGPNPDPTPPAQPPSKPPPKPPSSVQWL